MGPNFNLAAIRILSLTISETWSRTVYYLRDYQHRPSQRRILGRVLINRHLET